MTHRVYVRWPDQRVSNKTVTDDESVARFAFEALRQRLDLLGTRAGVAWTTNGRQRDYHDFMIQRSGTMSEPAPPPYVAGAAASHAHAAIEILATRAEALDRQIDALMAGTGVGTGITADYLALQLVQIRAALDLLRAKAAAAREPIVA